MKNKHRNKIFKKYSQTWNPSETVAVFAPRSTGKAYLGWQYEMCKPYQASNHDFEIFGEEEFLARRYEYSDRDLEILTNK